MAGYDTGAAGGDGQLYQFTTPSLSSIYSIQYVSDVSDGCGDSPKDGEVVRIECTVSAVDSSGFYW